MRKTRKHTVGSSARVSPLAPMTRQQESRRSLRERTFITNVETRRNRLLKRMLGIVRKLLQLGWIAGSDMQFILGISSRNPRKSQDGYNCFASSSGTSPTETLALWERRLALDTKRKKPHFEVFGPERNPKKISSTLFSFPHKALFPDPNARGYPEGDPEDEELWEEMEEKKARRERNRRESRAHYRSRTFSRSCHSDSESDLSPYEREHSVIRSRRSKVVTPSRFVEGSSDPGEESDSESSSESEILTREPELDSSTVKVSATSQSPEDSSDSEMDSLAREPELDSPTVQVSSASQSPEDNREALRCFIDSFD